MQQVLEFIDDALIGAHIFPKTTTLKVEAPPLVPPAEEYVPLGTVVSQFLAGREKRQADQAAKAAEKRCAYCGWSEAEPRRMADGEERTLAVASTKNNLPTRFVCSAPECVKAEARR